MAEFGGDVYSVTGIPVAGTGDAAAGAQMFGGTGAGIAAGFLNRAMDTLFMIPQGFINNWITGEQYRDRLRMNMDASKEMIDYMNAYNHPKAQMQRLAEAGLNPNLIYGNAGVNQSSENSTMSAQTNQPNYTSTDIAQAALAMSQIKQQGASVNLLNAEARLKNAEAEAKELYNERYPELLDTQVSQAHADLRRTASQIDLNRSDLAYKAAQTHLSYVDAMYRQGQIGLQQYERQVMVAQTKMYMSNSYLARHQAGYYDKLGEYYGQETLNAQIEHKILEIQEEYERIMKDPEISKERRDKELELLKNDARRSMATIGIEGSKFISWYQWFLDRSEQATRMWKNINQ